MRNTPNEIVYHNGDIRVVQTWIGHAESLAYYDVEQFDRGYWKSRIVRLFGNRNDAVAHAEYLRADLDNAR